MFPFCFFCFFQLHFFRSTRVEFSRSPTMLSLHFENLFSSSSSSAFLVCGFDCATLSNVAFNLISIRAVLVTSLYSGERGGDGCTLFNACKAQEHHCGRLLINFPYSLLFSCSFCSVRSFILFSLLSVIAASVSTNSIEYAFHHVLSSSSDSWCFSSSTFSPFFHNENQNNLVANLWLQKHTQRHFSRFFPCFYCQDNFYSIEMGTNLQTFCCWFVCAVCLPCVCVCVCVCVMVGHHRDSYCFRFRFSMLVKCVCAVFRVVADCSFSCSFFPWIAFFPLATILYTHTHTLFMTFAFFASTCFKLKISSWWVQFCINVPCQGASFHARTTLIGGGAAGFWCYTHVKLITLTWLFLYLLIPKKYWKKCFGFSLCVWVCVWWSACVSNMCYPARRGCVVFLKRTFSCSWTTSTMKGLHSTLPACAHTSFIAHVHRERMSCLLHIKLFDLSASFSDHQF